MVLGGAREVRPMKSTNLAQWGIVALVGWVILPFLFPLLVLYVVVRIVNAVLIGRSVQEVHNES
tara:strand:- start:1363 stop:1554 length:192 start_codon:yes stop_codon:yes gene_type:complete